MISIQRFPAITVNYDQPIEEMIKAGNYRFVSEHITAEHFFSFRTGIAQLEGFLVNFGSGRPARTIADVVRRGSLTTAGVLRRLSKSGLRAADAIELLAFAARNSDNQRVVCLDSVWSEEDNVLVVEQAHPSIGRDLILHDYHCRWSDYYWFLAFPK